LAISGFTKKFAVRGYQGEKFSLPLPSHKIIPQPRFKLDTTATKTTMSSENIEKYVKYNEKHGVLICNPHGYGLVPGDGIGRHFQIYHQSISVENRKEIAHYATTLPLTDPEDVIPPDPDEGPIEGLQLEKNGFICIHDDCDGYVSAKENTMIQHCRNVHGRQSNDEIMWRKQAVQTFFSGIIFIYHLTFRKISQLLSSNFTS